ncbi:MAG: hypothetical protein V1740_05405 [Candidatus Woesearchaeota archaeon]
MKKMIILFSILILALPIVFSDGADGSVPGDVIVTHECVPPVIYVDPTARIWEPNDQTFYTANPVTGYGLPDINHYFYTGYTVPHRQNYVFTGETLKYFIAVYDEDGDADIDDINLLLDGDPVGSCTYLMLPQVVAITSSYLNAHFNIPYDPDDPEIILGPGGNEDLFNFYVCTLIAQSIDSTKRMEYRESCSSAGNRRSIRQLHVSKYCNKLME